MPVITPETTSLPPIDEGFAGHSTQWLYPRLSVSLLLLTLVLVGLLLRRQTVRAELVKRLALVNPAEAALFPRNSPLSLPGPDYLVRPKQGQRRLENRAKLAVSSGGASGTALAGPGGACKGGSMEEEDGRPSAESRSRGVSTGAKDDIEGSRGLSFLPSTLSSAPVSERNDHVRMFAIHAARREEYQLRMEDTRFPGVRTGLAHGPLAGTTPGHISTSFLGHHMVDDEHILYGIQEADDPGSPSVEGWSPSTHRRPEHDFTRPPSPPLGPPASPGRSSLDAAHEEEYTNTIAIPPRTRTSGDGRGLFLSEDAASPSSYPPTSPLLPPPPATTYEAFDPAAVMFPGPARDGGIRMVPVDHDEKGGPAHVDGPVSESLAGPGPSWQRHTRVYGGGVCLACVAAAGGGGFYGDSVRPEDKR